MNSTEKASWVSDPDGRGTFGLLSSCFATILICTWNAVHPNLPADDEPSWKIFLRRCSYMAAGIVAPEFITACALGEFFGTQALKAKQQGLIHPSKKTPWSRKMYFLLLMGGFAVQNKPDKRIRVEPKKLLQLIREDQVALPEIEDSDIDDRSKADAFTKAIAVLQIIWFMATLFTRFAQHLPVTTLELFTAGTVICAIFTYISWFEKPFDIKSPFVLYPTRPEVNIPSIFDIKRTAITGQDYDREGYFNVDIIVGSIVSAVFGALHVIGWNFEFPSPAERLLWRIASVSCGALPLLIIAVGLALEWLDRGKREGKLTVLVRKLVIFPLGAVYILVRIYLLVETFAGLRSVPVGVYETPEWSQYLPVLGS